MPDVFYLNWSVERLQTNCQRTRNTTMRKVRVQRVATPTLNALQVRCRAVQAYTAFPCALLGTSSSASPESRGAGGSDAIDMCFAEVLIDADDPLLVVRCCAEIGAGSLCNSASAINADAVQCMHNSIVGH